MKVTEIPVFQPECVGIGQIIGSPKVHPAYSLPPIEIDNRVPVYHRDAASLWVPDSKGMVKVIPGIGMHATLHADKGDVLGHIGEG